MSAWRGKFVIGLTGNIATGKSVVRKMLEHLGAYGIDADALAHRAIAKGAPGYQPVVEEFGKWILASDGQVNRTRLGRIVFAEPEALVRLEAIVHPLVGQAVDLLVRRSIQKVIVIEAIKLLESGLGSVCDTIWVSYVPEEIQLARLTQKRKLSKAAAHQRVKAQPPQGKKIAAADLVIRNEGTFEDTWQQVVEGWLSLFPEAETIPAQREAAVRGELLVERAGPQQADEIAAYLTEHSDGGKQYDRADVMAFFGEKAFLLLRADQELVGLVGWQIENLVARAANVTLDPTQPIEESMRVMMQEIESASRELQCEALLLFLSPEMVKQESVWRNLEYQRRSIESLSVRAWQEAARESMPPGTVMLFKQLREDRVLRPI